MIINFYNLIIEPVFIFLIKNSCSVLLLKTTVIVLSKLFNLHSKIRNVIDNSLHIFKTLEKNNLLKMVISLYYG